MAEHTKLPWRVWEERGEFTIYSGEADPWYVCDLHGGAGHPDLPDPIAANAAFIVRACNSHDALVKALRDAREALYWHRGGSFEPDGSDGKTIDQIIDAALLAAREVKP